MGQFEMPTSEDQLKKKKKKKLGLVEPPQAKRGWLDSLGVGFSHPHFTSWGWLNHPQTSHRPPLKAKWGWLATPFFVTIPMGKSIN
jgi:hypothetical protein